MRPGGFRAVIESSVPYGGGLSSSASLEMALVTLLVPASALLLGALVFGERLDWNELLGMAVILAGLVVIDGRVLVALAGKLDKPASR